MRSLGSDRVRARQIVGVLVAVAVVVGPVALTALAGDRDLGTPPPTPVGPQGSLSPFLTRLHTSVDHSTPPEIAAPSAILADLDTGQVLFAKNADQARPIASVTKIMTALLVLGRTDPTDVVTVSDRAAPPTDVLGVSELGLEPGERIRVGDLTWALLMQSANDAAVALAEHVGGSVDRFVKLMNAKARRLGMTHTRFRSPDGLDDRGHASARDLVTLTREASMDARFATIVETKFHKVASPEGPDRELQNRNVLLWLYPGATGVKTGYTAAARFCLVATAARDGRDLIAVVLGDAGEPFSDAASLLDYGFGAFRRHRFVTTGEGFGDIALRGGSVGVSAGEGLSALVPIRSIADAHRTIVVDPNAAFPPSPGEQVAVVRVTIPGRVLGSVGLIVTDVPPPASVDERPWWERASGSVVRGLSGAIGAVLG